MAFLALAVGSDGLVLLGAYWLEWDSTSYVINRMRAEIIPTMVHLLGLAGLAVGLALSDPTAVPIARQLNKSERTFLGVTGWTLIVTGLSMKLAAMHLMGISNLLEYLDQLYVYDTSIREFGFLDQGVALAVFGIVLLVVNYEGKLVRQATLLMVGMAIALVLSTSKSGLLLLAVPFYILTRTLSPKTLKAWSRLPVIAVVGTLFIIGLGIKAQIKYGGLDKIDATSENVIDVAQATIQARFSGSGLYKGYTHLVNRLLEDPSKRLDFAVAAEVFSGVVPRFIWNEFLSAEKPEHPFHAKGELIHEDYIVDEYGNDAPTLVGFAFADSGFWSLVLYLTLGGMMLGAIRKFAVSRNRNVLVLIGYAYFAALLGPSLAESGFTNILYDGAWGGIVIVIPWAVVKILSAIKLVGMRRIVYVPTQ